MAIADLTTAAAWIRAELLGVTAANGYPVTIKSSDGKIDDNREKQAPALLPKAWLFVQNGDGPRPVKGSTNRAVECPYLLDVQFDVTMPKQGGANKFDRDETCHLFVDSVKRRLRQSLAAAPTLPFTVAFADSASIEYHYTKGPLTAVRIPLLVTVWDK